MTGGNPEGGGNEHRPDDAQLPLPEVIERQPIEDAGALTHARYRFQWEVGARSCLSMLTEEEIVAVLCEWHEDHIVIYADESLELVSVKHREPSEGPWTLRALCVDGGVGHLYERWIGLERAPSCRVSTNAGLRGGELQAAEFAAACHSRDEARIRPFAARILRYLGATDVEDVIGFCMRLSIEANLPGRAHITASNVQDLTVPALRALGLDASTPEVPYQAVVALVERSSRDRADRVTPQSIVEVARFETDTARPALIRSRLVTKSAVRAAVMAAITPGGIPLVPIGGIATRSNLVKKLERGGIGPTAIRSAQRLRAIWSELEARYRTDLPSSNREIEDIRTRVMDLVAVAEGRLSRHAPDERYGQELMTNVRDLVRVDGLGRVPGLPVEDRHLLGLVYQLTDECNVWWSDEFDLEAAAS